MNIIRDFVSEDKYNLKSPYNMEPRFVVIHNTANDASAAKEGAYMKGNSYATSFHYAADDLECRQFLPENRNAFHAGDGSLGEGNRYGISIEICYSKSGGEKFALAEDNAARLTADILMRYGWDISRVKKHQDFSGKYCPHRTLDMGWDRFLRRVEFFMNTKFNDIEGHWAQKHIEKLQEYGIVNGAGDGNFNPDKPITRAEAAVMIANALTFIGK